MAKPRKHTVDRAKVHQAIELLLDGLGLDLQGKHFAETPERASKAWVEELCKGLGEEDFSLTTFPVEEDYESSMIVLQRIPVKSMCAHHLLPFVGEATVAYIPDQLLCGLSKLSRIVDYFARRPQVQEELTSQVAQYLYDQLQPQGVGVIMKASHMCMEMRGVNHSGLMTTSSLKGIFLKDPKVREEFMALAHAQTLNRM